jgi:hypothetical protein
LSTTRNGSPRKSRRRRLGGATYRGTPQFKPTEAEWKSVEEAYGTSLRLTQKGELTKIVTDYFRNEPFETAAPFVDDTLSYLLSVTGSAREFLRALQFTPPKALVPLHRGYDGLKGWQDFWVD